MIDLLLNFLPEKSNFLNLFSYLTTRTVLATLTGLMMVLFLGEIFITRARRLQFNQPFSDRGRRENKSGDAPAVVPGRVCLMLDLLPESEESSCGK